MSPERPRRISPREDSTLDVLWVSTVPEDELRPHALAAPPTYGVFDPDDYRPVHGTLTVDVRHERDRRLLERLLNTNRVLSITAADGWSQRVRLTGVRRVDTEEQPDGSLIAVATYSWIAAASFN